MQSRQRPDAIDTRIIYWVYAALLASGGFILFGCGPIWLGSHFLDQPWDKAALIRVLVSVLLATACFSVALAEVENPESRRRGLFWFGAGHAVVLGVVLVQRYAIWGSGLADRAVELLLVATVTFFYLWQTAEGHRDVKVRPMISLFSDKSPPSTEHLRSQYEEQIRQAASQEERNRLARDLHDSVKQQIFVIQTAAATVQARFHMDPAGAKQALDQVRNSAREAMTEMQVMLDQLRATPLENAGLVEALKKQCEALGFRTGAKVDFEPMKLPPSETFAPGAQEAILRVGQEALANVGRHARAGKVLVSLRPANGNVLLRIDDDGAGFDTNERFHGVGIANMRARAKEFRGRFDLASRPEGGTSVTFSVPYTVRRAREYRRKVLYWAPVLLVSVLHYTWGRSPNYVTLLVACISAIAFSREAIAYFRTRRQTGISQ